MKQLNKPLSTYTDVAALLGFSVEVIEGMVALGHIPAPLPFPGGPRFLSAAIREWNDLDRPYVDDIPYVRDFLYGWSDADHAAYNSMTPDQAKLCRIQDGFIAELRQEVAELRELIAATCCN